MIKRGDLLTVDIVDYAFGGRGIAKLNTENGDYIVFVDNAFPGQTVECRIAKKKRKYAEAKLLKIIKRSSIEELNDFQEISGGPYIYVPVDEQEKYKKQSTLEVFRRIGGVQSPIDLFDEFISSPDHYFYRNKMEYSFSSIEHDRETDEDIDDAFSLGFKRRGTWWKVESLDSPSGMFDENWESKLKELRLHLEASGLPAWHPPKKTGFFRHIVVRKSFHQDQLLINLVTSSEGVKSFDKKSFVKLLIDNFGDRIAGIQHTINDNVADRAKIENGQCELLYGKPVVIEKLLGLDFEISMESFFPNKSKVCREAVYQSIGLRC